MAKDLDRDALVTKYEANLAKEQDKRKSLGEKRSKAEEKVKAANESLTKIDDEIREREQAITDLTERVNWAKSMPSPATAQPVAADDAFGTDSEDEDEPATV